MFFQAMQSKDQEANDDRGTSEARKRSRSPSLSPANPSDVNYDPRIHNHLFPKRTCPEEKAPSTTSDTLTVSSSYEKRPQTQRKTDSRVVENIVSRIFEHIDKSQSKRKEQLLLWQKNGKFFLDPCVSPEDYFFCLSKFFRALQLSIPLIHG